MLNSLISRFSRARKKSLFCLRIGPPNSNPYRRLLAGVELNAKGSVAFTEESLSVKKRAPWSESRPGLVKISTRPPRYGGVSYSDENMSGFTRIEAMEDLGGSALLFWKPSTVMMACPGAPPLLAASTCSWRLKSSGSSAMPCRSWAVSVWVPAP